MASEHADRIAALSEPLQATEEFWRPSPFTQSQPDWCTDHPNLAQACMDLDESELANIENDPAAVRKLVLPFIPALKTLTEVEGSVACAIPAAPAANRRVRDSTGIPGRKWQQIEAFAACIPKNRTPLLDWCSGKSHLGRNVARWQQRPLFAVERNATLCADGETLARAAGVGATFFEADVLRDPVIPPPEAQVLALHACGDLHRTLVEGPVLDSAQAICLAPCCYHLWLRDDYIPLSQCGRAVDLKLDRNAVQLAVQETVHAPARELRKQRTLSAWRLSFDLLQREIRGVDAYLPTPSIPHRELEHGFLHVLERLAERKGLLLPQPLDLRQLEAAGWERLRRANRLRLVRQAFRRSIEIWLVSDLALRLEERGFAVDLTTFCDRAVTPRNLLLRGERL